MKIISTEAEIQAMSSNAKIQMQCVCGKFFEKVKKEHTRNMKRDVPHDTYCTIECSGLHRRTLQDLPCKNCGKNFHQKSSKQAFCGQSCSGTWSNTHKTHGTRRSKLEAWLEEQLTQLFPNEEIHFNRKDAINSELDIFFPQRRIAFELNGIFHYEPIFGTEKLNQIQNNDARKFSACAENGIGLCIIDASRQMNFNSKTSQKYLDIILKVLSEDLPA